MDSGSREHVDKWALSTVFKVYDLPPQGGKPPGSVGNPVCTHHATLQTNCIQPAAVMRLSGIMREFAYAAYISTMEGDRTPSQICQLRPDQDQPLDDLRRSR
jgi:hypothetical protein